MKKNLMSVLIMALVFVNVVLSGVIMMTLVPSAKKANELITQVGSAIDLELNSGKNFNANTIPIDQTDVITLTGEQPETFTLKSGSDGKEHYVVTKVSITLNKSDTDYEQMKPLLVDANREILLQEVISNTFLKYSLEDIKSSEGQEEVRNEMLEQMQDIFDSDFIVAVNFSSPNYQ